MDTKALALAEKDYIIGERRRFHAHPELGTEEYETTKHIAEELRRMGIDVRTFDDITGCVGTLRGGRPGKTVMLRADIDALPIQEADLTKPYASRNPGVMHACGHDCHTAMLLGAAKILAAHREEIPGTVKFIFQMAEEIGTESRHYVEKGCLDGVDAIYGMHVWIQLPTGTVNIEDGPRMACSDRFTIRIHGAPQRARQHPRRRGGRHGAPVPRIPRERPPEHLRPHHRHDERRHTGQHRRRGDGARRHRARLRQRFPPLRAGAHPQDRGKDRRSLRLHRGVLLLLRPRAAHQRLPCPQ